MRRAIPILAIICLAGCHGRDSQSVGIWSAQGGVITVTADHKWSMPILSSVKVEGDWKFEGADAVLTPVTVGGKPVADAKKRFLETMAKLGQTNETLRQFANDLDKPNFFTLSEDGKTLTTDKSKDQNAGPPQTFTKQPPS